MFCVKSTVLCQKPYMFNHFLYELIYRDMVVSDTLFIVFILYEIYDFIIFIHFLKHILK